LTGQEALERLLEGNTRFLAGDGQMSSGKYDRDHLVDSQSPFAAVLSCSDSRVPPEHIFDVGLGEIFVVRVAGNVVGSSVLGSMEYAVGSLDVPLLLVLGHESCGAVKAALEGSAGGAVGRLVELIEPSIGGLDPADRVIDKAVRENVNHSVSQLAELSSTIGARVRSGEIMVAGAHYSLRSGEVSTL